MKRIAFFVPHEGCPCQCSFCNQRTISGISTMPSPKEVRTELEKAVKLLGDEISSAQIAFFGGSFTAIDESLRNPLLDVAKEFCHQYNMEGIRFSTRPDCITEDILEGLSDYPIAQIELGTQSMDDEVLNLNMRGHSVQDSLDAVALLQQYKYPFTLQMMTGLYGDTPEKSWNTANQILSLHPNDVRIYPTLVLKGTYLENLYVKGIYQPWTLEESVRFCAALLELFEQHYTPVIRLGLHQDEGLQGDVVAGPYHPAFRELCQGELLYHKAIKCLQEQEKTNGTLWVSTKDISKITGHGGRVKKKFEESGYELIFKSSADLSMGEIKIV